MSVAGVTRFTGTVGTLGHTRCLMNSFDRDILLFLNRLMGRWPGWDGFINGFEQSNLLKGALFFALIWYLWFRPQHSEQQTLQVRQKLVATLYALTVGIILARSLADLLPLRVRPAFNPELNLRIPPTLRPTGLLSWSSFPSDHAVVWFTVAWGSLALDRKLGVLACGYAVFLGFGRVYMGVHYPSDIIGAAAIAAGVTWVCHRERVRTALYAPVARLQLGHPGAFHAAAFLLTYEIASMFDHVRALGWSAWQALHHAAPLVGAR